MTLWGQDSRHLGTESVYSKPTRACYQSSSRQSAGHFRASVVVFALLSPSIESVLKCFRGAQVQAKEICEIPRWWRRPFQTHLRALQAPGITQGSLDWWTEAAPRGPSRAVYLCVTRSNLERNRACLPSFLEIRVVLKVFSWFQGGAS